MSRLFEDRRRLVTLGAIALAIVASVVIAGRSPKAGAATRVPTDPNEVIETLVQNKPGVVDPRRRQIAELRRVLAAEPKNLRAAVILARLDIQLAREEADPRYLGHAQAVLEPWWNEAAPPVVLVLRATIEQSLHDFDAALRHLAAALAAAPDDVQAWLTQAVVLTVRGRYDEARASCAKVDALVGGVAAAVCRTQIDSVNGQARAAHDRLLGELATKTTPDTEEWALSSLGEYAARFGDEARAEDYFRRALAIAPTDAYARAALADRLIDAGRFGEAAALVAGHENDDGMLLRLAIAERRGKLAHADEHIAMLGARFDASRARGDVVHRREESRFWLDLHDDARRALSLAQANWEVQKEPWDVRVVLAAAVAAHDRAAAAPILEWIERTKLEDPMIQKLAAELR